MIYTLYESIVTIFTCSDDRCCGAVFPDAIYAIGPESPSPGANISVAGAGSGYRRHVRINKYNICYNGAQSRARRLIDGDYIPRAGNNPLLGTNVESETLKKSDLSQYRVVVM